MNPGSGPDAASEPARRASMEAGRGRPRKPSAIRAPMRAFASFCRDLESAPCTKTGDLPHSENIGP
jgi:hypothetical protein